MGVGEGQAEEGTTREGVIGGERGPFLAKGSEAKRAVVIAGVGSGSAFRGEDQRSSSLRATDLFRRMVRRISGRTMIDD